MRRSALLLLSSLTFIIPSHQIFSDSYGDLDDDEETITTTTSQENQPVQPVQPAPRPTPQPKPAPQTPISSTQSFTGKIVKNKVRLRTQPTLDAPIVQEFNKGDMIIVLDGNDDFYAVLPPAGTKAYVYRTYILDNVVEGNKVNVRLDADVDAPVIAQLNGGDKVIGTISSKNSKWLEITPPANTRFYIAKDYVEKIGDASLLGKIEKRRAEVNNLLATTSDTADKEMTKNFSEINADAVTANYNKIINSYTDFPDQVAKAKELLVRFQDEYLKKKIAYLEARAGNSTQIEELKNQQQKVALLEKQLQQERQNRSTTLAAPRKNTGGISDKMSVWLPVEQSLYETWAAANDNKSMDEFYTEQSQQAFAIKGILEPYTRVVKNKPGDYVIINQSNHLPVAFVYSTQIDLQNYVGQEVTVFGAPRANNNFAYPAYFVLGLE